MAVKNKKEKEVEKEQNENVSKKHDETVSEGSENQSESSIKEEDGQTSEDKYDDLNNRFLRLYAEFENFRKTRKNRILTKAIYKLIDLNQNRNRPS